ncbi:MAG: four helix bundle protein [Patescibacteria group bacterium]
MIETYKDLIIWQKGIEIVSAAYQFTARFPKEEIYGLTSQMRRAAVSIPSNIAEGRSRSTRKDFLQFLRIASGSLAELETQLIVSEKLGLGDVAHSKKLLALLDEEKRMLNSMMKKLKLPPSEKLNSLTAQ